MPVAGRGPSLSALVTSLDRDELLRALSCAIELLLGEIDEVQDLARQVEPQLRAMAAYRLQWERAAYRRLQPSATDAIMSRRG
jgi:hypothetical protein